MTPPQSIPRTSLHHTMPVKRQKGCFMPLHPTTFARIDLRALVNNYRRIQADTDAQVLCVVKADGYGHGAVPCASALYGAGARWFGVANPTEAIELRRGLQKPDAQILILGYSAPEDIPLLIEESITQTVYSAEYARAILHQVPCGARLRVHIKLDSGMNRLGFSTRADRRAEMLADLMPILADPRIDAQGVFTHFACADEPENPMTEAQWNAFCDTVAAIGQEGITFPYVHACNSAGIYRLPAAHGNLVRAGIILYGIKPSEQAEGPELQPVMSLHTHVTHVHTLRAGETIGYGAAFRTEIDRTVATLAIGYADGLIRAYGGCGVRIGGKECELIGRICMDQCMADVSGMEVSPGDEAVFFDAVHPVTELSGRAGMIPYETLCLIGKRVPRIYIDPPQALSHEET